ncbi:MAG TPA: hypothetical protein VEQ61_03385 [Thermoleophilaceae bacterium]|nr:hypothetical protein [Thermoleophilaceae bacterium]
MTTGRLCHYRLACTVVERLEALSPHDGSWHPVRQAAEDLLLSRAADSHGTQALRDSLSAVLGDLTLQGAISDRSARDLQQMIGACGPAERAPAGDYLHA